MIQDGPMQYLHSSARRLYRIFIHAYEHHNEMFRAFEVLVKKFLILMKNETGLYTLFFAVTARHGLVPRELITIPSDYRESTEEAEDYSRPTHQGTLYESSSIIVNGEVD